MTQYALCFVGYDDPGSIASAQFSALFVILVPFTYPPIAPYVPTSTHPCPAAGGAPLSLCADDPRNIYWQTLLVRVLALLTAAVAALIVNFVFSAAAPLQIYRTLMFYLEGFVWHSLGGVFFCFACSLFS